MEDVLEKLIETIKKYRDEAIKLATGVEERREFFKQLIDIVIMDVEALRDKVIELADRIDKIEEALKS